MWELGTAAAALAALLVPAAPGQAAPLRAQQAPACVVPVDGALDGCPRDDLRAPVLCIVPVAGFVPAPPEPACPEPVPDQRARIVPVSP